MPEEELEEVKAPKKRGGRPKKVVSENKITGQVKRDDFSLALSDIERDSLVNASDVADILVSAMEQAYLEWSYPGLYRDKDSNDLVKQLVRCKVVISDDISNFKIYDIKVVTNEDDIIDDAYQVSLEDAKEINPDAKLGDQVEIPFDVTKLDKKYVRRVKQLFQAKLKEASKQAITSVYSNQIGGLITGRVVKVEGANPNRPDAKVSYELSFGKADGFLRGNNLIPGDKFAVGDNVLVFLNNVSDKSNPPSLSISRSTDKFVIKLFERAVPELASGVVKIKGIAREAGKRTKIFVESSNPNIDPVGTCIGPESSRYRTVTSQLNNEKVDIIKYQKNKAMQILEAMKPATIVGLACPEDFFDPNVHYDELEMERGYEFPDVTAVVSAQDQGVAIGSSGVNVRLASRLTMCTISVTTVDNAIKDKLKYMLTQDIIREVEKHDGSAEKPEPETEEKEAEEVSEVEAVEPETQNETAEEETAPVSEEVKAEAEPEASEPANNANELKPNPTSTTSEIKNQAQEIEHVEIKNKPKISLKELEEAMGQKKGPAETRSYKKHRKEEEKEETTSLAKNVQAMPIYTDEELEALQNQDFDEDENDYDYDEELDEQYDSDSYYDEDKK